MQLHYCLSCCCDPATWRAAMTVPPPVMPWHAAACLAVVHCCPHCVLPAHAMCCPPIGCDMGTGKPAVFGSWVSWFWVQVKPVQTCIHSEPLPTGYGFFTVNGSYRPGSVAITRLVMS